MNEDEGHQAAEQGGEVTYDLQSVKEAARLLRVSESTVWRYADQSLLPAYRVGRKRVMFRRGDLEALLNRLRGKDRKTAMKGTDSLRLTSISSSSVRAVDAMLRARELRGGILTRRGGIVVSEAWEDINAAREERMADL
jgi:excisionase family DNA binding protein